MRYWESAGGKGGSGGSGEEIQRLQRELEQAVRRAEASEQLVADFQQSLNQKDEVIRSNEEALRSKDDVIKSNEEALRSKDEVVRSKDEALLQKERKKEDIQKGWGEGWGSEAGTGLQLLRLQWEKEPLAPSRHLGRHLLCMGR